MSIKQVKWLLRIGIPVAGFVTALLCGRSVPAAIGMVALTAGIIAVSMVEVFGLVGILFVSVVAIYGRKAETDLQNPDTTLFLFMGIPATLLTVALLSLFLKT